MFQARTINAEHKDLIHDVAYDFYGRRLATCSSDQSVKVVKSLCFKSADVFSCLFSFNRYSIWMRMMNGDVQQIGRLMQVLFGKLIGPIQNSVKS